MTFKFSRICWNQCNLILNSAPSEDITFKYACIYGLHVEQQVELFYQNFTVFAY